MLSHSPPHVLILAENPGQARDWAEPLRHAAAQVWLSAAEVPPDALVDVVVTDQPSPSAVARSGTTRYAGIVGIGAADWADVKLSSDFSGAELRLACALLAEVARLQAERQQLAEVQDQFQQLAHTDPLTGLPNRRAWDLQLPLKQRAAATAGQPFWLALADLDGLKRVNDAGGLARGDDALRGAAQALAAALRHDDLIARLGGDEFGVLLVGADETSTAAVFERLRAAVADRDARPGIERLTVSVGYAGATHSQAAPAELFAAAEVALRRAKQAGGNRVVRGSSRS